VGRKGWGGGWEGWWGGVGNGKGCRKWCMVGGFGESVRGRIAAFREKMG